LSFQSYFFSEETVFFSHNKSVNSTFSLSFQWSEEAVACFNQSDMIAGFYGRHACINSRRTLLVRRVRVFNFLFNDFVLFYLYYKPNTNFGRRI
jgi:hypothetical protein